MTEPEKIILSDSNLILDENIIKSLIKEGYVNWQELHDKLIIDFPDCNGSWNYYKDGKQWLYKMQLKKKTLFWASLLERSFRVTFYFGDKAEPVITQSNIKSSIKEQFAVSKKYGAVRAVSLIVSDYDDIEQVMLLANIKSKLK